jgi:hypothetical protein
MDEAALLTTCAGAGATLFAIVGGYLVSQALRVSSELQGTKRLLVDLQKQVKLNSNWAASDGRDLLQAQLNEIVANPLVEKELVDRAMSGDVQLRFDDIRRIVDVSLIDAIPLQVALDQWSDEISTALKSELFGKLGPSTDPPTWQEFALLQAVSGSRTDSLWAAAYYTIGEQVHGWTAPRPPRPNYSSLTQQREAVANSSAQVALRTRFERDLAKSRVESYPSNNGLVGGVVLLIVLFALTVLPSLWLLTTEHDRVTASDGALVFGFFIGGVAILLIDLLVISLRAGNE